MIKAHSGKLVKQILNRQKKEEFLALNLPRLGLNGEQIKDVINIGTGVYSPLVGFLKKKDYGEVVREMRLANGVLWPIPIVLDIEEEDKKRFSEKNEVLLTDYENVPIGIIKNFEIFEYDKKEMAERIYGTLDISHPGVKHSLDMKDFLLGGEVWIFDSYPKIFENYNFTPIETRRIFKDKKWNNVVAFQTRNVPHRGHEFLQKTALKKVDGLFIQPVIGKKKNGDFKDEYILSAYETLIENYYPRDRVLLGVLPLQMKYGGPREAILHAIIRQNYGCSHFIIGRDHAGVNGFYGKYEAQDIFDSLEKKDLAINILKYDEVLYSLDRKRHIFANQKKKDEKIEKFSGTKIRDMILKKKSPAKYLMRAKVFDLLATSANTLVDDEYNEQVKQKGCVLWFTGLSQSGKTTTGKRVCEILRKMGHKVERLDGDIVRNTISKDLGFTKKDRDENISRVAFVANLLAKSNIIAVASFISPYEKKRKEMKKSVHNFVEIFVNTPLEVCEERDGKGLYKLARQGKIKNFTGISDPYEIPKKPDIIVNPHIDNEEKCAQKVIAYLFEKKYI